MSLDEKKIEHLKQMLGHELKRVEEELATVGQKNPDDPNDWVVKPDDMDIMEADLNEAADRNEERIDNAAILNELEIRLNHIKRALDKIEAGTYGTCEVGGEKISEERLTANPAALTCIDHTSKLHE